MSAAYFNHPYCSNSDLSKLKLELLPVDQQQDYYNAYRMGTLIDAAITTPDLVDYFKMTVIGTNYLYAQAEFDVCKKMKASFLQDVYCATLLKMCSGQKEVYKKDHPLSYNGIDFTLNMRCKFDLYSEALGIGPDIKSTTATTYAQFEAACLHFDYFRQRAVYMALAGFKKDMLIGISKVAPYKVFKIPIVHGDKFHQIGQQQFEELAFKYYMLCTTN